MSERKREDRGRRERPSDDRASAGDRDGSIPFLEELFRGDDPVAEAIRRRR